VGCGVGDLEPGDRVAGAAVGPHRQRVLAWRERVARVPDGLDWVDAACTYWVTPPYRGLLSAKVQPDDRAAVIGLGPIGLCAVQLLRPDAREVLAVDPLAMRRACGERFGARALAPEECADAVADVVVELSGTQAGLELALRIAAPLGRVVVLGVLPRLNNFELFRPMQDKGLSLVPLFRRGPSVYDDPPDPISHYVETALRLVLKGAVDVRSLCSRVLPWRDGPRAVRELRERPDGLISVALRWDTDG
jgi:threonine dehydrogenase-like Zn-dependent dehydrogenase